MIEIKAGQRVRAWTGALCTVLCICRHATHDASLVVIRRDDTGACWAWPVDQFLGQIWREGEPCLPRFAALKDGPEPEGGEGG